MNTKLTRVVGAASAAAIATLGFASAAFAADGVAANPGAIDPDAKGSITLHKAAGDPVKGGNNDGAEWAGWAEQTPLPGAGFTMWTVDCGVNLTTNQGWKDLADLVGKVSANPGKSALEAEGCTLTSKGELTTDENGEIVWADLPVGLYYFQETTTPENYKSVLPFLVTVPMTNPEDGSSWMYDINVYPKDRDFPTKTPSDGEMKPGALVDWTVKAPAPYYPDGTKSFQMTDLLDPKLSYVGTKSVFATDADGKNVATFERETDYQIIAGQKDGKVFLVMELTEAGRLKMDALVKDNPAISINWTLTTKVETVGELENEAIIWENKPGFGGEGVVIPPVEGCDPEEEICEETVPPTECEEGDPGCTPLPPVTPEECEDDDPECTSTVPPTPEECEEGDEDCTPINPSITKWGGIDITKIAHDDKTLFLEGAEFEVWGSQVSAEEACKLNGKTAMLHGKGVTDENGKLKIDPLRYSDFADGASVTEDSGKYIWYCLVETKAPAGYELLPEGIPFTVSADNVNGEFFVESEVENVLKNGGFELPLTGGIGTMIFIVAGGVLLVGAVRMARRSSKVEA